MSVEIESESYDVCDENIEEELTYEQQCSNEIKRWITFDNPFYGRTDDEFISMFLHGCKFNLEKTKKKITMYYENRKKIPQWWANRDLTQECIKSLAHLNTTVALIDKDPNYPLVAFTIGYRFGPDQGDFDEYGKLSSLILEVIMRRQNCKKNGLIWIVDCRNYPGWLLRRFLWPPTSKNVITSFYLSMPFKIRRVIFLDAPKILIAAYNIIKHLLSEKLRQRVHFYGSNWSNFGDHVDMNYLPEEYGGNAGPIQLHDDLFLEELLSYTEYFVDDNRYGFQ
ncbi:hypothetical protein CHUAL_010895 [Chamberlinius hualienensis]